MDNNVFTVKNLSFAYGRQQVLKNLDLELHEGKITTLIGANGCGKSTLFNLMTKNLKPDEGEILLRGGNIAEMRLKDFAREVSIVHQYNTAPVDLSVEKLVGYGRTPYHTMGLSPDPKEDEEWLAMMETYTYPELPSDPVTEATEPAEESTDCEIVTVTTGDAQETTPVEIVSSGGTTALGLLKSMVVTAILGLLVYLLVKKLRELHSDQ